MFKSSKFLWHLIGSGAVGFANIAHLLAIASMGITLVLALLDKSKTEVILGISIALIAEFCGLIADFLKRLANDRERKIINEEILQINNSLGLTSQKAENLALLLEPRLVSGPIKKQLVLNLSKSGFKDTLIKICYDGGFDSSIYAGEFMKIFSKAGWKTEDEGSLLLSVSSIRGIQLLCNENTKGKADFVFNVIQKSGEKLIKIGIDNTVSNDVIRLIVYRDPKKLGG